MTTTPVLSNFNCILRKKVEKRFGLRIATAKECMMLADDIYDKTSVSINFNTIRRFYGLVKTKYPVSKATIGILSAYCGFNSHEAMIDPEISNRHLNEKESLLLKFVVDIFKNTAVTPNSGETFNSFVRVTIEHLHENVPLMKLLQKEIAKTQNGIDFYFERNVNYDKLNSFFGDGLHYYISESQSHEKRAFAYSLFCLREWLACNDESLKNNLQIIKKLTIPQSASTLIWAMYFSAFLLHANSFSSETERILTEAMEFHDLTKKANVTVHVAQSFEYIYSNALILTGNYEHALYYVDYALKHYTDISDKNDNYSKQKLLLLKTIALARLKKMEESKKIYQLLKPSNFDFFSAKLDTALYLILTKDINKGRRNEALQLEEIIADSGFVRLRKMYYE